MYNSWKDKIDAYVEENAKKAERLLKEIAVIPAPSGKEQRRSSYCMKWLMNEGASNLYIDNAGNLIYPYEAEYSDELEVYMAHLDVVFQDEEKLLIKEKDRLLKGPGVGDDTANLVNLLMAASFFAKEKPKLKTGILFVFDVCEEGLGNLKGCRQLMEDFAGRIKRVVSFDLYLGHCFDISVGSLRYEITNKTKGGHSFSDFGNDSAIHNISRLVCRLYEQTVPVEYATTYNVGIINGGTSVNTIAQNASVLYEIRSMNKECLKKMQLMFENIIEDFKTDGTFFEVNEIGNRPCADIENTDSYNKHKKLIEDVCLCIKNITGKETVREPASTDANIPLSLSIPAVTLGTIVGGGAHTREEWVDLNSQRMGMKLVLAVIFSGKEYKKEGFSDFF